jgi:hypothetical protein
MACPGEVGDVCTYGTTSCTCGAGAAVGMDRWTCGTCPATQPANASMCTSADLMCAYDGTNCTCMGFAGPAGGGGMRWECAAPCPATQPTPGATCDTAAGTMCAYGTTSCDCRATTPGGATTWFCN